MAAAGLEPQVFTGEGPGAPAGDGQAGPARQVLRRPDRTEAAGVLEKELSPLAYMLYPLRASSETPCGRKSALSLLSAGWRTRGGFAEYGRSVQNFSWSEFYEAYHGEAYFEWMRRQLGSEELDALVQGWQRLRSWLDEDRQFLLWRQSLATRVAEWEGSKRHNAGVLPGRRETCGASRRQTPGRPSGSGRWSWPASFYRTIRRPSTGARSADTRTCRRAT